VNPAGAQIRWHSAWPGSLSCRVGNRSQLLLQETRTLETLITGLEGRWMKTNTLGFQRLTRLECCKDPYSTPISLESFPRRCAFVGYFSLAAPKQDFASSPDFTSARIADSDCPTSPQSTKETTVAVSRKTALAATHSQRRREGSGINLLLRFLRFDLLSHDCLRTAPFVSLSRCGDFVSRQRQTCARLCWCPRFGQ